MSHRGNARRVAGAVICFLIIANSPSAAAAVAVDPRRSDADMWTMRGDDDRVEIRLQRGRLPRAYGLTSVEPQELKSTLERAPMETVRSIGPRTVETYPQPRPTIVLPMPDGSFATVAIEESPILSHELQAQYPDIRTFRGEGVEDRTMTARLDHTPAGFHAQLICERGTVYIDPVKGPAPDMYISYWKRDLEGTPFRCLFDPAKDGQPASPIPDEARDAARRSFPVPLTNPSGTQLRTYRLAVSATGEYGAFFGGVAQAAAQITTTVNRVTGIYERDLAIRFNLVATRIYTDKNTDPFTGDNVDVMRGENQTELDTNVGSANYDIGHIVSQGGSGGIASLAVACTAGSKARGATSTGNPSGDGFDVDFVAHEMGHQMGGDHTFDGTSDPNCGGNRVAGSAYEPGSGATIMAYAGVCGAENIQPHSDPFFHTRSFDQIRAYSSAGGACGTLTATGNNVPVVNAGPDFTIPQSTPFTLTGSATDADGDTLTYDWEQFDLGPGIGQPSPTYSGPLFRSYSATLSPSRTLPRLQDLLSGAATPWEVLPGINRDLNFRLTARDNRANGGGSDYDSMVVHVSGAPFSIISAGPFECGMTGTLTWNVGGAADPNIRALLSTDNGVSFPTTLLASTPNDGSEPFTVPKSLTTQGWIQLQPIGNIYFALKGPLSIVDTLSPTVVAPANLSNVECTSCSPRGASPAIGTATATDVCDPTLSISSNAPAVFPLGTTTVEWSATDDSGNVGHASQSVQVVDTTPPSLTAPAAVVAECTGSSGTPVALGSPTVSDVCWCSAVTVTNNAPASFPLGDTVVTWKAVDGSGNMSFASQNVKIQDTTPPTLSVTVMPSLLWSPNHKLVNIHADIVTADICDSSPTVRLLSISSNEPDDGLGDGDTAGDVQGAAFGTDDRDFQLRAERSGNGTGRVYTIVYESRDHSGNFTVQSVTVIVPHDRSR